MPGQTNINPSDDAKYIGQEIRKGFMAVVSLLGAGFFVVAISMPNTPDEAPTHTDANLIYEELRSMNHHLSRIKKELKFDIKDYDSLKMVCDEDYRNGNLECKVRSIYGGN